MISEANRIEIERAVKALNEYKEGHGDAMRPSLEHSAREYGDKPGIMKLYFRYDDTVVYQNSGGETIH
jgi:hypothetical protein